MGRAKNGQKLGKCQEVALQIQVLWGVKPCRLVVTVVSKNRTALSLKCQAAPEELHCF